MADLSKLSTADLQALQAGNLAAVSTEGLKALRGVPAAVAAPATAPQEQRKGFQQFVESNPVAAGLVGLGGGLVKGATGVLQTGAQLAGMDDLAKAAGEVTKDINRDVNRLGTAGAVGGFVGEVAPYVALPAAAPTLAGRVGLRAAGGALAGGLQAQETPDLAERASDALTGAAVGAVIPVGLAGAGKALQGIAPTVDQEVAKLASKAKEFGIPLSMTQVAPSRVKNTLQKVTQEVPFSGTQGFRESQVEAWNKAVAKTLGVDAERLTPDAVNTFLNNTEKGFANALKGKTITAGADDVVAIRNIVAEAKDTVGGDALRVIEANAKKAIGELSAGDVDGQKIANFRSSLIKRIPRMEAGAKQYVGELVEKIDEVTERSVGPEAAQQLQGLRRQWRNFRTLEPLLEKSADQPISPAALMQRVAASPFIKAARKSVGEDDLVDLAKIGKMMPELGGSDTFQKTALGAAGVGALLEPTTLALTGSVAGASRAYQSLYNQSQRLVDAAVKRSLPNAKPTMLQRVSQALVGGSADDVVRAAGSKEQAIKTVRAIGAQGDDATRAEANQLVEEIRSGSSSMANPTTPASTPNPMRNSQRGSLQGISAPVAVGGTAAGALAAGNFASSLAVPNEGPAQDAWANQPRDVRQANEMAKQLDQATEQDLRSMSTEQLKQMLAQVRAPMPAPVSATFIIAEEGFRPTAYKDSVGITTIGYGFNLEQPNARDVIKRVKIPETYEGLRSGREQLSEASARKLFDYKHRKSETAAASIVPNFTSLGENQRAALTSMAYHMGGSGLRKFRQTLAYLKQGNAKAVENQLLSSLMAEQTPARAQRTALMLAYNLSPQEAEQRLLEQGRISPQERQFMQPTPQAQVAPRQRVRYNDAKRMVGLGDA